jgi:chromosome segregation ATPase
VQELDDETKRLRGQHVTDLVKVQELERENQTLGHDLDMAMERARELERDHQSHIERANEEIANRERSQIYASQCQAATARMAIKVEELEREVARLKEAMKGIAQEAHLVSIRLANAAVSPDDLKTMLAK